MSKVVRVRLPRDLDEALSEMCESTGVPLSTAIRECIRFALDDPAAWTLFQSAAAFTTVDTRSPEAVAAYERFEKELEAFDMQAIARQQGMV